MSKLLTAMAQMMVDTCPKCGGTGSELSGIDGAGDVVYGPCPACKGVREAILYNIASYDLPPEEIDTREIVK